MFVCEFFRFFDVKNVFYILPAFLTRFFGLGVGEDASDEAFFGDGDVHYLADAFGDDVALVVAADFFFFRMERDRDKIVNPLIIR